MVWMENECEDYLLVHSLIKPVIEKSPCYFSSNENMEVRLLRDGCVRGVKHEVREGHRHLKVNLLPQLRGPCLDASQMGVGVITVHVKCFRCSTSC